MTKNRPPKRNMEDSEGPVVIYEGVESVVARKGAESQYPGELFEHVFDSKPSLVGLPNGDLLITSRPLANPAKLRRRLTPTGRKR